MLLCLAFPAAFSQASPPSATGASLTTDSGIKIHYLEAGSNASLPTLVLIPGWRLPAFLWNEQLQKFSHVTRVIAIDPRSQGESSKTTEGNSPESRARDLRDVLGKLHISRCVLVGWSQGAQDVAAYLQAFGTEAIAGVVFVDSPVSFGADEVTLHAKFAQAILSGLAIYVNHPREFSEGMVRSLFKKSHPELNLDEIVRSTLQTPTETGAQMLVMDIFGADRRAALAKLDKPALVVASSASPLLDLQKEMSGSMPTSKLIVIEEAGHAVFIDEPQKFDKALDAFLRSLDASRQ
jgi:non-heme chloroperoxidase